MSIEPAVLNDDLPVPADAPDVAHRFFVYCPEAAKFYYFKTAAERDLYANKAVIEGFLDDGWHDGVEQVVAGELTHTCVKMAGEPMDFEMKSLDA